MCLSSTGWGFGEGVDDDVEDAEGVVGVGVEEEEGENMELYSSGERAGRLSARAALWMSGFEEDEKRRGGVQLWRWDASFETRFVTS